MRSNTYLNYKIAAFLLAIATCGVTTVKAQVNPLASQYFQNQYLFNPAMAGLNKGLTINLDYSKQSFGVEGSQSEQAISADYQMNKMGLGVYVYNQMSGVFRQTRGMVTYAYHLPIADGQQLHFGLSAGVINNHLELSNVFGDQSDPTLANYNSKGTSIEGDLGVAYTNKKFTLQAALPNLKTLAKDNGSLQEREIAFAAASYKFFDPSSVSVEPKVAYRNVKGFDNIIDGGVNVAFNDNQFSLQGLYHSTKSATFGFGLNLSGYSILAFYTSNTSALNGYTNGDVEVSLKFNLGKK